MRLPGCASQMCFRPEFFGGRTSHALFRNVILRFKGTRLETSSNPRSVCAGHHRSFENGRRERIDAQNIWVGCDGANSWVRPVRSHRSQTRRRFGRPRGIALPRPELASKTCGRSPSTFFFPTFESSNGVWVEVFGLFNRIPLETPMVDASHSHRFRSPGRPRRPIEPQINLRRALGLLESKSKWLGARASGPRPKAGALPIFEWPEYSSWRRPSNQLVADWRHWQ